MSTWPFAVVRDDWPDALPDDDDLGLPASRHWRPLDRLHVVGRATVSAAERAQPGGRNGVRHPNPKVLQVVDSRPLARPCGRDRRPLRRHRPARGREA